MTRDRSRIPRARRGFTLVELVVASGIAAVLLLSLGSVVMLSATAMPAEASAARQSITAAGIVADLRAELQAAERIVHWSDHAISFTLPDRDADGVPERVAYTWSGTPGDPLQRRYGTGPAADLLPGVGGFHLAARRSIRTERYPDTALEDALSTEVATVDTGEAAQLELELDLALESGDGSVPPPTIALTTTSWSAQMIEPRLPPGVVAWRPTRAEVVLKQAALSAARVTAELRPPQWWRPGPETVVADDVSLALVVDAVNWQAFSFASAPIVAAGEGVALVLRGSTTNTQDRRIVWTGDPGISGLAGRVASTDGGTTWVRADGQALEHRVFGRLFRSSGHRTLPHVSAEGFDVRLALEGTAPFEAFIDLPPRPALEAARWTLDLSGGDPTTIDDDGDGTPDWRLRGGGVFDRYAGPVLEGMPRDALDTPTVVELEAQCDADGSAVVLRVDAANDAGGSMPVMLTVQASDTRGQTLSVMAADGGTLERLAVRRDRPLAEPVTARLVIDPAGGGVHVVLDGVDFGTLPIERLAIPPVHGGVSLSLGGTKVTTARVSVVRPEPLP